MPHSIRGTTLPLGLEYSQLIGCNPWQSSLNLVQALSMDQDTQSLLPEALSILNRMQIGAAYNSISPSVTLLSNQPRFLNAFSS